MKTQYAVGVVTSMPQRIASFGPGAYSHLAASADGTRSAVRTLGGLGTILDILRPDGALDREHAVLDQTRGWVTGCVTDSSGSIHFSMTARVSERTNRLSVVTMRPHISSPAMPESVLPFAEVTVLRMDPSPRLLLCVDDRDVVHALGSRGREVLVLGEGAVVKRRTLHHRSTSFSAIASGHDGSLLIADMGGSRLIELGRTTPSRVLAALPDGSWPMDLAVESDGCVCSADPGSSTVTRAHPSGALQRFELAPDGVRAAGAAPTSLRIVAGRACARAGERLFALPDGEDRVLQPIARVRNLVDWCADPLSGAIVALDRDGGLWSIPGPE